MDCVPDRGRALPSIGTPLTPGRIRCGVASPARSSPESPVRTAPTSPSSCSRRATRSSGWSAAADRDAARTSGASARRVQLVHGDLVDAASLRRAVLRASAPTCSTTWRRRRSSRTRGPTRPATMAAIAGGTATLLAAARQSSRRCGCRRQLRRDLRRRGRVAAARALADASAQPLRRGQARRPRPGGRDARAPRPPRCPARITFNHESPRRPPRFLPRKVTRGVAAIKLGRRDELVLGDLDAVRDWCDARDVVRGLRLMAGADEPGDYVLASGVSRTVARPRRRGLRRRRAVRAGRVRVDPAFVRPPSHAAARRPVPGARAWGGGRRSPSSRRSPTCWPRSARWLPGWAVGMTPGACQHSDNWRVSVVVSSRAVAEKFRDRDTRPGGWRCGYSSRSSDTPVRNAWVLRVVGNTRGPVLVRRDSSDRSVVSQLDPR